MLTDTTISGWFLISLFEANKRTNLLLQSARLHQCGNGVVDAGEDCDCGRRDECLDSCCDPITCTLRAHAQCASHQQCCHRCEIRPSGFVCRESTSVCDVPEFCDGESGDCAADGHLIDGVVSWYMLCCVFLRITKTFDDYFCRLVA